ncbi:MAG TPA: VWA domain-containing protein, partial [Blastocatellia bacterium]|nr:VWA domain-containing protein [Blastocatellia bacterium]
GETPVAPGEPTAGDIRRIFAFVVDDLTTRYDDLVYVREMLTNFVDNQMQPTDLVAIVRTVGGKGLLQQFTTDKALLRRAIAALTPKTHALSAFNNQQDARITSRPQPATDGGSASADTAATGGAFDISTGEPVDINSGVEDSNKTIRAYMSLGTASFVIESMKQLPGRKSLVLISGGLPVLTRQGTADAGNISYLLNVLTDHATRAGVAIHTMDIRGLEAHRAVASFEDTPGRSMLGGGRAGPAGGSFGRTADESLLGANPIESHQSLRILAANTGGVAVLNKNNFNEGLEQIVSASDGYYLLAYTPADEKFDNKFRKVEVKVRGGDYKVYSRRGYFAREDKPEAAPTTPRDQLLAAIRSPLARRDIDLDATLLYKAAQPDQGAVDINVVVDPKKLQFEEVDGKQQTSFEVAGFVFDELGKLRGGFSETVTASLTPDQRRLANKGGLSYTQSTTLPPGIYQIRLAVRDTRTNKIGTMSRYLEVPDLSGGRFAASSLFLGSVPPGDMKTAPAPIAANRQISRKNDLRYAVFIYNPKLKDGKPQVRTQLTISQNGKPLFSEPETEVAVSGKDTPQQLLKWGQIGLGGVQPGRYTLTLTITDTLADKKANTITRNMDFVVVD